MINKHMMHSMNEQSLGTAHLRGEMATEGSALYGAQEHESMMGQ